MRWSGAWSSTDSPYQFGDVVNDDGWTMVCASKDGCTDRPAPQPTGEEFYAYDGTSPTGQQVAAQLVFGNRYTFNTGAYLNGYRVYTIAGNEYNVFYVVDGEITELLAFTSTSTGWQGFPLSSVIVPSGTVLDLVALVREPDPTPTTWTGDWNYTTPPNPGPTVAGEAQQANSTTGIIRFNKTDNVGGNRGAELLALNVGDVIVLDTTRWAIQGISDGGTYVEFAVAPTVQHAPDGVYTFTFETITPTPITYLEDPNYWATSPYSVEGLLGETYSAAVVSDNAYGTDLLVQEANVSDEWELVSAPGAGSGGGDDGVKLQSGRWAGTLDAQSDAFITYSPAFTSRPALVVTPERGTNSAAVGHVISNSATGAQVRCTVGATANST